MTFSPLPFPFVLSDFFAIADAPWYGATDAADSERSDESGSSVRPCSRNPGFVAPRTDESSSSLRSDDDASVAPYYRAGACATAGFAYHLGSYRHGVAGEVGMNPYRVPPALLAAIAFVCAAPLMAEEPATPTSSPHAAEPAKPRSLEEAVAG